MANSNITPSLTDVRFYTSLDPYYYVTDNRPLEDLNSNITLIAEATESSAGSANRAALSTTSVATSILGYGGTYNHTGEVPYDAYFTDIGKCTGQVHTAGLTLSLMHGFAVFKTDGGNVEGLTYDKPVSAVHDTVSRFTMVAGNTYLIEASRRKATTSDAVGASEASIDALVYNARSAQGLNLPTTSGGSIATILVVIPAGATEILPEHVVYLNFLDLDQTSNPLERSKIKYNELTTVVVSGNRYVNLVGSDIVLDSMDSVEVLVDGVDQFHWIYDSVNQRIDLGNPVTSDANVKIRQAVLAPA